MHLSLPHPHTLLANRELGSLYLTSGLLHFGMSLLSVFIPVYLWKLGYSLGWIMFFYLLISAYFVAAAFALTPILRALSDKMMMFLGIPLLILYFHGLNMLEADPHLFYIAPLAAALFALLFFTGYHIDFSSVAKRDHMGKEVGGRFMTDLLFVLAAPFVGGIIIAAYGFHAAFYAGTVILFLSVIPLFFFPRRSMGATTTRTNIVKYISNEKIRPLNISAAGYAMEHSITTVLWYLFIFFAIGSIEQFGGIVSAGLLAAAFVNFFFGYISDKGARRKVLSFAASSFSFVWFSRLFYAAAPLVVGSHIIGQLIYQGTIVSWASQYYKVAQAVSDTGSFILSREIIYNGSRVIMWGVLIGIYTIFPTWLFAAAFLIAAGSSLLFISANRVHIPDFFDGFLMKKKI